MIIWLLVSLITTNSKDGKPFKQSCLLLFVLIILLCDLGKIIWVNWCHYFKGEELLSNTQSLGSFLQLNIE